MLQALLSLGNGACPDNRRIVAAAGLESPCMECPMAANNRDISCAENDAKEGNDDASHDGDEEVILNFQNSALQ